ncbi:MAG: hydroxyisourate hydrolase [Gammaproteobacteria bacterium]|nr:hydroxyisourate hydrolase [Gammaproteobacteria bacterium]
MGKLTTHILDTSLGIPAQGVTINLHRRKDGRSVLIKTTQTNADGRCDESLLSDTHLLAGGYEIEFDIEQYFNNRGIDSPFLKDVVVRFHISDASESYHVPLLISPFSYSTYRGS